MKKEGKIYGVSLGPGDPELISLKGYKLLQQADKVYFPGSVKQDQNKQSFSEKILQHHGIEPARCRGIYLYMQPGREANQSIYQEAADEIYRDFREGKTLVIVTQGDLNFYSTFGYLLEELQQKNLPLELVPGIPAFLAGAARWQQSLCRQHQPVLILPELDSTEIIATYLEQFPVLVIMKISKIFDKLLPFLENTTCSWCYCEQLGTEREFITEQVQDLYNRRIPYFALLLIKNNNAL